MPSGAQWCSLCFADQRAPGRVREMVPAAAPATDPGALVEDVAPIPTPVAGHVASVLAGTPLDPRTPVPGASVAATGSALTPLSNARLAEAVAVSVTSASASGAAGSTWPCPRCGDQVALALDVCDSCGAGFLAGASAQVSTRLPLIGDMTALSSGQRWLAAMGISVVLVVVLVLLAFVVGEVF